MLFSGTAQGNAHSRSLVEDWERGTPRPPPPPYSTGNEGLGLRAESLRKNMDELGDTVTGPSSSSPCPKKGGAGSV